MTNAHKQLVAAASVMLALAACGARAPEAIWKHEAINTLYPHEVVVDGNRAFIAPGRADAPLVRRLAAIDVNTGKELWARDIKPRDVSAWTVIADRIVYSSPAEPQAGQPARQSLIALDAATGTEVWRFGDERADDDPTWSGPYLLVPNTSSQLILLDAATGKTLAAYPATVPAAEMNGATGNNIRATFSPKAYYLLSPAGVLRAFDVPSGRALPTLQLALGGQPDALFVAGPRVYVHTKPGYPGQVSAFDATSGKVLWREEESFGFSEEVMTPSGPLAVLFREKGVGVYDAVSGRKLYEALIDRQEIRADGYTLHGAEPQALLTFTGGKLVARELATGKQMWSSGAIDTIHLAIGARDGAAFAISGYQTGDRAIYASRLNVFDVATGQALWTLAQPVNAAVFAGQRLLAESGEMQNVERSAVILSLYALRP